ncbi:cellulase family glycosylhydrolase [Amycolatopsis acidiphila]|uniref:cellulase family glycosylhydrolase n=1 Tax=Amycolatopsis acidiphila TaxID=715473 RepID=UPI002278B32F|nr:cellulase family glycosylhydrolase [Amycolatopsis acidiphila]
MQAGGAPVSWLGANFWSRTGGPRMWHRYDRAVVREELRVLAGHGLNMTRSFFFWPDFMPEPDRLDEDCVQAYADFLDAHEELGLGTIPTFLVGHMSGANFDPPWRAGRDLYTDVWLVARQAWYIERLTRRFAGHPAVVGWLISNEMPIYGDPSTQDPVTSWATLMVQAVRAGGGTQPVSVGDGAWGAEVTGVHNGFSVRDLAAFTDFVGPHVYPMGDDPVRQQYTAAFNCELAGAFGLPVVLEEFGLSSDFAAPEHAARYYRQVLHTSLLAGATGWIAWNNTDFDDLAGEDPYRHHPFELHFGLTTTDGTPKPQLGELAAFAKTVADLDLPRCHREPAQAALVVPEHFEGAIPISDPVDNKFPYAVLRQAYVSAKLADIPVGLTRERDGIDEDCALYVVPSTKELTAPTWRRLEQLAEAGAVVYVSYCHGESAFQRGPWYAGLNTVFGVEHQLRYGLADRIEDDEVRLTFAEGFGELAAGSTLTFPVAGNEHSRSYLPVRPVSAQVLATDRQGRPALLRRRTGSGAILLCTYPLEHMTDRTAEVNPNDLQVLYDALADFAGLRRPLTVADPAVSAEVLAHDDGRRFVFLLGHGDEPVTVKPRAAGRLVEPDGRAEVREVSLAPGGVRVLLLEESQPSVS